MVAPPAKAWMTAMSPSEMLSETAFAPTTTNTRTAAVIAQPPNARRESNPGCLRIDAAPRNRFGDVADRNRHEQHHSPPSMSETPSAVFSGIPSSSDPSISAQPNAAGAELVLDQMIRDDVHERTREQRRARDPHSLDRERRREQLRRHRRNHRAGTESHQRCEQRLGRL